MNWVCAVFRCVALQVVGRKRRIQMKYGLSPLSVWLSPILLAPLLFNVAPLPHNQSAAGLASGWLNTPNSAQPLINQTHKYLYLHPKNVTTPPPAAFCKLWNSVNRTLTQNNC